MKSGCCLFLFLVLGQTAFGQRELKIYHLLNRDSSVSIFSENHGFVPFTIPLRLELVNMHSVPPLPPKQVIFPSKEPRLLTTLVPDRRPYSFRYKVPSYQLGGYTGHAPDTSHVYSLPFQLSTSAALPPYSTSSPTAPGNRYPYFFALPAGAAVCAARTGVVATIRQDVAKTEGAQANFIIVYHEDDGVAWYQNLQKNTALVKVGQRVAVGDTLGYLSSEKQHLPLYFDVEYPGEEAPQAVPVTFRVGDKLLRLHQR
jgi:murein DD-endopeptidase MepM/ murein hydrolase activator NlpD